MLHFGVESVRQCTQAVNQKSWKEAILGLSEGSRLKGQLWRYRTTLTFMRAMQPFQLPTSVATKSALVEGIEDAAPSNLWLSHCSVHASYQPVMRSVVFHHLTLVPEGFGLSELS